MKTIVSTLALVVVAACVMSIQVEARTKYKKHGYAKYRPGYEAHRTTGRRNVEKYEEFIADKRPIGTSGWWDQMLRENRAGTCCN